MPLKHFLVCGCGDCRGQTLIPQISILPDPMAHKATCQLSGSHTGSWFGSKRPKYGDHITEKNKQTNKQEKNKTKTPHPMIEGHQHFRGKHTDFFCKCTQDVFSSGKIFSCDIYFLHAPFIHRQHPTKMLHHHLKNIHTFKIQNNLPRAKLFKVERTRFLYIWKSCKFTLQKWHTKEA